MSVAEDPAYTKTINQRADKIVATLGVSNENEAIKVRDIIADQYRNLNSIHTKRDHLISEIKKQQNVEKDALNNSIKKEEEKAT